jgi:hypothetical protein
VATGSHTELFNTKLEVHDRKQFELKLEYQPSGTDPESQYLVEAFLFIPGSLNITAETWPREDLYADLHNYVRLKTPVLSYEEILLGDHSPLLLVERALALGLPEGESEFVYDAKMLSCVTRGALRRFAKSLKDSVARWSRGKDDLEIERHAKAIEANVRATVSATKAITTRYRQVLSRAGSKVVLADKSRASLRLVDEYLSLLIEQFFRRAVVQMDALPRSSAFVELRRELLSTIVEDEAYRRASGLTSVLTHQGDNEEYTHRVGLLKKFCMNILFLRVQRGSSRKAWEEVLFAIAAGGSMALALGVGLLAQTRYPQASFNFFIVAVVGYMLKDRIKESLRRFFSSYAGRFLYERVTRITEPVTREVVGLCKERVDYGVSVQVPPEVTRLRSHDDLVTVAHGELSETVIRYRKKIVLDSEMLPRIADGLISGVTDIIRLNVGRLLHDMDDPEYPVDYVDAEDFSIERLTLSKAYRLDIAFRFAIDDGRHQRTILRLVRLVLDRNGIKRMTELGPHSLVSAPPQRPVVTLSTGATAPETT